MDEDLREWSLPPGEVFGFHIEYKRRIVFELRVGRKGVS